MFGAVISRMASVIATLPEGAESSGENEVSWHERLRREHKLMYIWRTSWAKIEASEPPAPGCISRRHGKEAKG